MGVTQTQYFTRSRKMSKQFISKRGDSNLSHPLQSRQWAEFRCAWGNDVVETRHGIITLHKIPFVGMFTSKAWKVATFIKGPMPTQQMLTDLKKLAKEKKLIFIKLEPNYVIKKDNINCADKLKVVNLLKRNGAVSGKTLFTPTTFWIDLTKTEDQLMNSFSSKTRYNIRIAIKHGVKVEVVEDPPSPRLRGASNSDKTFNKYLELTRETVERQGFYAHTEKYHRLMWKYLNKKQRTKNKEPIARLLTATYNGEIITCWVVFVYKDFLYYPYGASSEKYKNVMANNLMMWEAIKFGKKSGLTTFDLWGREPGKGFTRFKESYNPQVVEFLGTWDLVINKPLYLIYRISENLRWKFLRIPTKLGLMKPNF
uniref:FemAB n=2 Tax=Microgenomates group TaxID=1794810 RepID=A0A0H4T698_9BACT|nr:femAB [uncultured Microgenomates bacterium Rifle_16ft_4_minimus_37633]